MIPRKNSPKPQIDLFRLPFVNLLDLFHKLCNLSELLDWQIDTFQSDTQLKVHQAKLMKQVGYTE